MWIEEPGQVGGSFISHSLEGTAASPVAWLEALPDLESEATSVMILMEERETHLLLLILLASSRGKELLGSSLDVGHWMRSAVRYV